MFQVGDRVRLIRPSLDIGLGGEEGVIVRHISDHIPGHKSDQWRVRFDKPVQATVSADTTSLEWWAEEKDLEFVGGRAVMPDTREYLNALAEYGGENE